MARDRISLFAGALGLALVTRAAVAEVVAPGAGCSGGCGTVFSLDIKTGAEKVLHSFANEGGDDGFRPIAALLPSGNILYGTTLKGGTNGGGTAFAINRQSGTETILHAFAGGKDGLNPGAGLMMMDGLLYGTTEAGGGGGCAASGCGTVYSMDPTIGSVSVIYSFQSDGADGNSPADELIGVNGLLYGTTASGGSASCGCGTVFAIDPATGKETVLHSFSSGNDGAYPYSNLLNIDGMLYGTTIEGREPNGGTVFSIDPTTGAYTVLYAFAGSGDGFAPYAGLTLVGSTLYGTTCIRGASADGTVYSVDPTSGSVTILHSFDGADGMCPSAGVIDAGGTLYGATEFSGPSGDGTLFSVTTAGTETTILSFDGKDGRNAAATLSLAHGKLYGTTVKGGHPK